MRKHLCIRFFVLICISFTAPTAMADTTVPWNINADAHWAVDGSPYLAADGIYIGSGVTLTIDPGVVVKIGDGERIVVNGTLDAEWVEFTKTDTGESWEYITFNVDGQDVSRLDDCTVRDAAGGGSVKFAIHVFSGAPVLTGTTLIDCTADIGVYVQGGAPVIEKCTISGFRNCGIFVLGGPNPSVTDNTIADNGYGVRLSYSQSYPRSPFSAATSILTIPTGI